MNIKKTLCHLFFSCFPKTCRLSLFLAVACLIGKVGWAGTGTYSGGSGTEAEPYKIANLADILELAGTTDDYSEYFILTADIDMAGAGAFHEAVIAQDTSDSDDFQGTAFSGVFDGNGHVIQNLVIDPNDGNDYIGLFGYVRNDLNIAIIRDLGVENVSINSGGSGHKSLGGLIGEMYNGQVKRCFTTGVISIGDDCEMIGGLLGYSKFGDIYNSYSQCSVSCDDNAVMVGGLMGGCYNIDCKKNYSAGAVTAGAGSSDIGGFLGDCQDSIIALSNYWDINTSGQTVGVVATGLSTVEMSGKRTFLDGGWDFVNETGNGENDYWKSPTKSYPMFSWQEYSVGIADLRQLAGMWLTDSTDQSIVYPVDFWQDGNIDMMDFSMLSRSWLSEQMQLGFAAITDGFESSDFSVLNWSGEGNVLWEVSANGPYQGEYCAYVTGVQSMGVSELSLQVVVPGAAKVEFFYKISGSRMVLFYIDEDIVDALGQTTSWTNAQYDITEGEHTIKWVFYNFFGGSIEDNAQLDNLRIFSPN